MAVAVLDGQPPRSSHEIGLLLLRRSRTHHPDRSERIFRCGNLPRLASLETGNDELTERGDSVRDLLRERVGRLDQSPGEIRRHFHQLRKSFQAQVNSPSASQLPQVRHGDPLGRIVGWVLGMSFFQRCTHVGDSQSSDSINLRSGSLIAARRVAKTPVPKLRS